MTLSYLVMQQPSHCYLVLFRLQCYWMSALCSPLDRCHGSRLFSPTQSDLPSRGVRALLVSNECNCCFSWGLLSLVDYQFACGLLDLAPSPQSCAPPLTAASVFPWPFSQFQHLPFAHSCTSPRQSAQAYSWTFTSVWYMMFGFLFALLWAVNKALAIDLVQHISNGTYDLDTIFINNNNLISLCWNDFCVSVMKHHNSSSFYFC